MILLLVFINKCVFFFIIFFRFMFRSQNIREVEKKNILKHKQNAIRKYNQNKSSVETQTDISVKLYILLSDEYANGR